MISFFTDFILPRWKSWQKNDLSKEQIKSAITAKLVNSHSKTKKKNLRGQQLPGLEQDITGIGVTGGAANNDGNQPSEENVELV